MTQNILIRDLEQEDLTWIKESVPDGISQNEFLKSLLRKAREEEFSFTLFDNAVAPQALLENYLLNLSIYSPVSVDLDAA